MSETVVNLENPAAPDIHHTWKKSVIFWLTRGTFGNNKELKTYAHENKKIPHTSLRIMHNRLLRFCVDRCDRKHTKREKRPNWRAVGELWL
jgi:hypothetical protein